MQLVLRSLLEYTCYTPFYIRKEFDRIIPTQNFKFNNNYTFGGLIRYVWAVEGAKVSDGNS